MFENLEIFQTSTAMARHAGRRQVVVAQNLANADTPGYKAQSIAPFREAYRSDPTRALKSTRPGHIHDPGSGARAATEEAQAQPSPNGNSVSLENEMLQAIEVAREHRRALTIYKHALDVVRISIGRK
ncbi:FlgB family protein [Roseisalinus antarcticus]|uniref:Flagellar basal body rod protein FlgB n=1 Tax=Roseisalinus antarcticus TaxID=254357 RepID=A0A1Y5TFI0_9RHOB|nr:FlgB family protein [Roseisalinus antarcticus]SLN62884.1 flagellar basal body rod protein FlgB [Roseisalinus antarcticus]